MKKIPTMFVRDETNRSRVLPEVAPGCEWVLAGEGVATRKLDGTCCLIKGGALFKRRELRADDQPPAGFEFADHDDVTGKIVGWVPVRADDPSDRWHCEGFEQLCARSEYGNPRDGTYELIGPKVQGNPEGIGPLHQMVRHGETCGVFTFVEPVTFDSVKAAIQAMNWEGLVFHHPDGRMAKIKGRDFGLRRTAAQPALGS